MRLMLRAAAVAAGIIAISGPAFAGQATTAKPKAAVATAKPAKTTEITATGTVAKFDAASNTLTVTTPKGDVMFVVGSSAGVTENGKKAMASDLSTHVGQKVTVRYTESGGQKMAQSVRVSSPAAKTAAMKKTGTTKKS
jgi:hypothetical protein